MSICRRIYSKNLSSPSISVQGQESGLMMLVYDFISFPYDAKWRHLGWFKSLLTSLCSVKLVQFFHWNMSLNQFLCVNQLFDFTNIDISANNVYLYTNSKYKVRDLTQVNFEYVMLNINALRLSKGVIWYQ